MRSYQMTRIRRDILRVVLLVTVASLMLVGSGPLATLTGYPDFSVWGSFAALSLYGAALAQMLVRVYFPSMDGRSTLNKAMESATGAGLVFLARSLVLGAIILSLAPLAKAQGLPAGAVQYLPVLQAEQRAHWPTMPDPAVLAAQVEKETCITLKHARCWNPRAELRTEREQGVGFGQITRTSRFDSLLELKQQFPQQLASWGWGATLYDPALQMRGLVLMDLRNYRMFRTGAATEEDGLWFMLASYNGGTGGTLAEVSLCRGTPGCDPSRWFGHVEHTSKKARVAANGYGQGFFHINRGYVARIKERRVAYRGLV